MNMTEQVTTTNNSIAKVLSIAENTGANEGVSRNKKGTSQSTPVLADARPSRNASLLTNMMQYSTKYDTATNLPSSCDSPNNGRECHPSHSNVQFLDNDQIIIKLLSSLPSPLGTVLFFDDDGDNKSEKRKGRNMRIVYSLRCGGKQIS